jgi:hypothetical protein
VNVSQYGSPEAFRTALTARLRERSKASKWTLVQLQRQFAYDRFLERLYFEDDGWILKGATALLARNIGVRGSLDLDLYMPATHEIAEAIVRRAAQLPIDWMRFEVGLSKPMKVGIRLSITASIGSTRWVGFPIDIVGGELNITGAPDDVPALARGIMPDIAQRGYRVYPIVDHVADKVAATYEVYGASGQVSTRYRDLVDLVAIISGVSIKAEHQARALMSEFKRRSLEFPTAFAVPDRQAWERGYRLECAQSLLSLADDLDTALSLVGSFLNPLLLGKTEGTWSHDELRWL